MSNTFPLTATASPLASSELGEAKTKTAARYKAIPGSWAIWAAILAEMSEFAIMFIVYFIAKAHNPEVFEEGPTQHAYFYVIPAMIMFVYFFSNELARWTSL